MESILRSITVAVLSIGLAAPLSAQSIASGAVHGTIRDSTGRPLGNVRVALTDKVSGVAHAALTPRVGTFAFRFLPPGEYDLLAERLGFLPVEIRGVVVAAGGDAEVEAVLVPVEPPVLERAVEAFGGNRLDHAAAGPAWGLGALQLRRLADADRGVTAAGRFTSIADETLAIEGLPASFTQTAVDGIPFRFPTHPVLVNTEPGGTSLPLSAFASADVAPGGPDIEWSGFTAGRLAAIGLRGSNRFETRLYADWSPTALGSSKYFDPGSVSGQSFRGGLVITGPVIRDTAHFVLGVEAARLETPVPPAWEPSGADSALVAAADSLGVDLAPYRAPRLATTRVASGFGRFDWQASQRNRLAFLAFGSRLEADGPVAGEYRPSGLGSRHTSWDLGIGATLTNILSQTFALELRAGFEIGRREYAGDGTALTLTADGPASWGTDPLLPARAQRSGFRATETLHFISGRHQLKLGGGGNFSVHEDTYAYGRAGVFAFGGADDLLGLSGGFRQTVGPEPIAKFNRYELGWFVQDRFNFAPGAAWVLGFRMDWDRLERQALVRNPQLLALTGVVNDSINATALKVSPRAGLEWDIGNKHRWAVRVDGGVYHGHAPVDAFGEAVAGAGLRQLREGVGALGRWPGAPDSTAAALQGGIVSVLPFNFTAPRSTRAAMGVSGAMGGGVVLHLAGSFRHTRFLVRRRDINRVPGETGRDQYGRPLYGELEQRGSALLAVPGSGRRLDEFSVISAMNQDGVSDYYGATVRLERQIGRGLRLSAGYTYSRTTDNAPGLARGPDSQLSPFPDSLGGVEWEDGPSDFDVPHRFVFGAELGFPGFRVAAFYGFRSGVPFTPGFRDGVDANADGSWRNDPAWIDDQVPGLTDLFASWDCLRTQTGRFADRNSCRGPTLQTLDLRLALGPFRLGYPVELVLDAMNLLDTQWADVDRAVYLVDPAGTLTQDPATGIVTVPLVANPDFGRAIRRYGPGRYLRVGIRVNYE